MGGGLDRWESSGRLYIFSEKLGKPPKTKSSGFLTLFKGGGGDQNHVQNFFADFVLFWRLFGNIN